jgi:hypothetical protein
MRISPPIRLKKERIIMLKGTILSSTEPDRPTLGLEQKLRQLPKEKQSQVIAYTRGLRDGYHQRSVAITPSEEDQNGE